MWAWGKTIIYSKQHVHKFSLALVSPFKGPVQRVLRAPARLQQVSVAALQDEPRGGRLEQPQQRATWCQQVQIQSQQITVPESLGPALCSEPKQPHAALKHARWNVAFGWIAWFWTRLVFFLSLFPLLWSAPKGNGVHPRGCYCSGSGRRTRNRTKLFIPAVV